MSSQKNPLPGMWLDALGRSLDRVGASVLARQFDGPRQRYGASLDTQRARRELGFRPGYKVALQPTEGGGSRLEARPL